jgi:cytoskeletal protein CcmA (bactofilin family)
MWKKDEAAPGTARQTEAAPRPEAPRRAGTGGERATIGPSITIKGEVTGDEDLLIQGRVEGSVELQLQSVTVGTDGRVKANITGRVVVVEGEVEGDLRAQDQVVLRSSARVTGDITSPRVVLEDGARFRGLVDMGESAKGGATAGASTTAVGHGTAAKPDAEAPKASTEPPTASQDSNGAPSVTKSTPAKGKDSSSTVEGAAS